MMGLRAAVLGRSGGNIPPRPRAGALSCPSPAVLRAGVWTFPPARATVAHGRLRRVRAILLALLDTAIAAAFLLYPSRIARYYADYDRSVGPIRVITRPLVRYVESPANTWALRLIGSVWIVMGVFVLYFLRSVQVHARETLCAAFGERPPLTLGLPVTFGRTYRSKLRARAEEVTAWRRTDFNGWNSTCTRTRLRGCSRSTTRRSWRRTGGSLLSGRCWTRVRSRTASPSSGTGEAPISPRAGR